MTRKLLLLFCALLLAAGGYGLYGAFEEDPLEAALAWEEEETRRTAEGAELRTNEGPEYDGEENDGDGEAARSSAAAEFLARNELDRRGEDKPIDLGVGFELHVVDGATGSPVPSAEAWYFDTLAPGYRKFRRARGLYRQDKELALQRYGERAIAGSDGTAVLPWGIPTQNVTVRHGNLYGELRVSGKRKPPPDGYKVELFPDRSFHVQVLDQEGKPRPGIHVVFHVPIQNKKTGAIRWVMIVDRRPKVDSPDGIQVFPHIQHGLRSLRELSGGERRVYLGLDGPGLTRCGPTLDLEVLPDELIKVTMPPVGSIQVAVLDEEEMPVQRTVRLTAEKDFPDSPPPTWQLKTDEKGLMTFSNVGLSKVYQVASRGPAVAKTERVEFTGPVDPDEVVAVRLLREIQAALVEGRVTDEKGRSLREQKLAFRVQVQKAAPELAYLTKGELVTDQSGRFQLRLPPTVGEGKTAKNLYTFLILMAEASHPGLRPWGRVELPPQLQASQRYLLNPLQLKVTPLVASGQIFVNGKEAPDLRGLTVERLAIKTNKNKTRRREVWGKIGNPRVQPLGAGRFELRGKTTVQRHRLRMRSWRFLPNEPLEFRQGDRNLELRLTTGGKLRATVLHDLEVSGARFEVRLLPVRLDKGDLSGAALWRTLGHVDRRHSGNLLYRKVYAWGGLPAGSYQLQLRLLGETRPLAVAGRLRPVNTEDWLAVPSELINLRGRLRRIRVRAVDPRGRALAGLVIPVRDQTTGTLESVQLSRKGATLYTSYRSLDLKFVVKGYRPKIAYGVSTDKKVQLDQGIPVRVHVATRQALPKGISLDVRMLRRRQKGPPPRRYVTNLRNPFRPSGKILIDVVGERVLWLKRGRNRNYRGRLMLPGPFVLDLVLKKKGAKPISLRGFRPRRIEVQDSLQEQVFEVRVSQRRLVEVIKKLDPKAKITAPRGRPKGGKKGRPKGGQKGKPGQRKPGQGKKKRPGK